MNEKINTGEGMGEQVENAELIERVRGMSDEQLKAEIEGSLPAEVRERMQPEDYHLLLTVIPDILGSYPEYDLARAVPAAVERMKSSLGNLGSRDSFSDYFGKEPPKYVVERFGAVGSGKTLREAIENAKASRGD